MKNLISFFVVFFVALTATNIGQKIGGTNPPIEWHKNTIEALGQAPMLKDGDVVISDSGFTSWINSMEKHKELWNELAKKSDEVSTWDEFSEVLKSFEDSDFEKTSIKVYLVDNERSQTVEVWRSGSYGLLWDIKLNGAYCSEMGSATKLTHQKSVFNLHDNEKEGGFMVVKFGRSGKIDRILGLVPYECSNITALGWAKFEPIEECQETVVNCPDPDLSEVEGRLSRLEEGQQTIINKIDECCNEKKDDSSSFWDNLRFSFDAKLHLGFSPCVESSETTDPEKYRIGVKVNDVFGQLAMTASNEYGWALGVSLNGSDIDQWFDNGNVSFDMTDLSESDPFWISVKMPDGEVEFVEFTLSEFIKDGTEIVRYFQYGESDEVVLFEKAIWLEGGPRMRIALDQSENPWAFISGTGLYGSFHLNESSHLNFYGLYVEAGIEYYNWQISAKYLFESNKTDISDYYLEYGVGLEAANQFSRFGLGFGFTYLKFPNFERYEFGVSVPISFWKNW